MRKQICRSARRAASAWIQSVRSRTWIGRLLRRRRRRSVDTGEVIFEANDLVPRRSVERLKDRKQITELELFFPDWELCGNILSNTLREGHTRPTPRRR